MGAQAPTLNTKTQNTMTAAELNEKHEKCIKVLDIIKDNERMIASYSDSIKTFENMELSNLVDKFNAKIRKKQRMNAIMFNHYQQLTKTL